MEKKFCVLQKKFCHLGRTAQKKFGRTVWPNRTFGQSLLSHDKKSLSCPSYTKSKSPKLYKVQVSQSAQSTSPSKSKSPKAQVSQSPSYPRCPKSKSPKVFKVQVAKIAQSPSCPKSKLPKAQVA